MAELGQVDTPNMKTTVLNLSIQTLQLLTILVLKLEQVQFISLCLNIVG